MISLSILTFVPSNPELICSSGDFESAQYRFYAFLTTSCCVAITIKLCNFYKFKTLISHSILSFFTSNPELICSSSDSDSAQYRFYAFLTTGCRATVTTSFCKCKKLEVMLLSQFCIFFRIFFDQVVALVILILPNIGFMHF